MSSVRVTPPLIVLMLSAIHLLIDVYSIEAGQGRLFALLIQMMINYGQLTPASISVLGGHPLEPTLTVPSGSGLDLAARLVGLLGALLIAIVRGALIALEMAWDTWWALVLGFTITGAIQEFVSEDRLTDYLGDDEWHNVGYGTLFGASSSSCSFSAVAMTRTLFTKGASPAASLGAFQFASTNLVLELALVVLVLLGWQFVAAEIVGGLIGVVILGIVYRRFVPETWTKRARERARALEEIKCASCGMGVDLSDEEITHRRFDGERQYFCCGGCLNSYDPRDDRDAVTAGPELFSGERWKHATANTIREWDMLWRDIAFGFILAGLLAALVPTAWWTALFGVGAEGSPTWLVSNVIIGAAVGILTFLCSVGNVPFAVVLWQNGVSFGGILAFIFADLLILPLVRTYRRYYGLRMAGVMFAAFFLAAVTAGLAVEIVFGGLGLIPAAGDAGGTVPGTFTALLNVIALPIFAVQVYVSLEPHQRVRLGNRLAPYVAGILYRTYDLLRRIAYALESRGLK